MAVERQCHRAVILVSETAVYFEGGACHTLLEDILLCISSSQSPTRFVNRLRHGDLEQDHS